MPEYRVMIYEVWERAVVVAAAAKGEAEELARAGEYVREEGFEYSHVDAVDVEEEVTE